MLNGALLWNLILLAIGVLAAVLAVALAIWAIRRSARVGDPSTQLRPADKVAVALVGAGGIIAVPLSLYGLIASAVSTLGGASVYVDTLPVGGVYPAALRGSDAIVDASYATAWIEVANLPAGARALLWVSEALPVLAALAIAVTVAWLAIALLRGSPFVRALPAVIGAVAIAVIAAGLGSQVIGGIARAEVVAYLGPPEVITGPGGFSASLALDLGPIGWGLGLALVAAVFSIGTRMQRDVRGLV